MTGVHPKLGDVRFGKCDSSIKERGQHTRVVSSTSRSGFSVQGNVVDLPLRRQVLIGTDTYKNCAARGCSMSQDVSNFLPFSVSCIREHRLKGGQNRIASERTCVCTIGTRR